MAEVIAKQIGAPDKPVEELEKERAWWWAAEKKRSPRLDYLRKAVWKKGRKGGQYEPGLNIDIESAELFTQAWQAAEGDPMLLRRAKALAYMMENRTVFITDHAQLVATEGNLPNTLYYNVDSSRFGNDEIYNDPILVPEPREESLKRLGELHSYWNERDAIGAVFRFLLPEDAVKYIKATLMWGLPVGGSFGYSGKDYEYIFGPNQEVGGGKGFQDMIDEIQEQIDKAEAKLMDGTPDGD
ncbi:MAG: formate acetyltransferase, partial [Dehalococcoidia bacterium]|nr:formate acetyltransferase [Dehalococcoidia bacterium]